jgi:hypothetical protein
MTPPVAVLAGFGVDGLWQWLRHRPRLRIGLLIAVLVSAGVLSAGASATTLDRFVSAQARDAETAAWVASVVPSGATVYAFDITLRLRHSSDLKVHELFYETPQSLERALASGEPAYLVVNGWALEHQWQGHAVQAAYHWLRDVRGLTPLGQYGYFQLYKVLP